MRVHGRISGEQLVDLVNNKITEKQCLYPPVHSVKMANLVAQINIVANEMIYRCHALRQGRTHARFLVQGLLEKALLRGPFRRVRSACQESHLIFY